ncbi:probable disease resistance protein At1g61300 [Durio zibethinus]|uniref:Probable disease resistance protein At1g61300 n=1 Tax=Durio zibethinus TaxID=66656 RepID=A0A6P5WLU6_DURZI|nr:probable disease resistance protein At1g61300 [Durio zibethinus]XP_022717079.1 probable disease resistance protein At1g61300 [Durio zibethinus]XP_022717080.1 probable disease resistance protein At1g61300 [Durio zibethinus]XP_022717081.1 probable disease resistance protein At1g61300 [Durio zibethinus]XP_022717082.1 probable disease resistance protein At1g61300 [Durio zibethinus]XP_022717083.1 probable disease resistance protein At1g61300 [Durio zibethinus]
MLTPSSSSSSSIYPWKYDIFLSFSGKDTRKSFTDHLYAALKRYKINTFRDDNNLKRGEEIAPELLKAIGESWGSIIVFSEEYASSSWCLDELAEIVKQRKERGHQVFPIFYDVEVSDLRHQREKVQEAFAMHEERYKENKDKTQRWRDALSQVANISGWPLKDQYESNFIENIVEEISAKLDAKKIVLDQNLTILMRKLEELNGLKEDNESMKSVQLQPRKKLKKEVEIWLRNVERINGEILNLENEVRGSNIVSRGFLVETVSKKIQEVEELHQKGKIFDALVIDEPQWIGQVLSTTKLIGDVAKEVMNEIWAYLMDDGVSKIGVWGMGGVGKTTVMKLINNQLLKETEKFNRVIWITVSKELKISKLQDGIAKAMQESLPEVEDEAIRAGVLNEMLSQKGKYVLILDDLWDKVSLEDVGIPEPSNGSKLLVTSRLLEVCRYLGCQEVRMGILSKPDAWSLFSQKVGQDVLNEPQLLPIVESVAEECAGLPLAIVTIASSMKGERHIHEWRNALHELVTHEESVSGLEGKVFQQLQFSYDRLHSEKLKHCFLCCALYPEDHEILAFDLIDLWIAEGLVEEMDSRQLEVDKGHAILNKLKNSCLIENGTRYPDRFVKMHDILRDMALRITSTRPRFLVRAGLRLKEIPKAQEWKEDLEKVSLMVNYQLRIPCQISPPRCPKLTTLLLSCCDVKSIPECFFEQMHGLKILDLSGNHFQSLPNSISNLENLTTLLLDECRDLEEVPSFSGLQSLKKLDLRHTKIKDLPHGFERLVNLKYLDLSCTNITEVADGILANFTSLQHLAIMNFNIATYRFKGKEAVNRFVRGEEIGRLRKLEYFEGGFYDLNECNNYIKALHAPTEGPRQYCIFAGEAPMLTLWQKGIQLIRCNICRDGIKVLSDVENLLIGECIIDLCEEEAFSSRLILPPHNVFSSLSQIRIHCCQNIKKLFSFNWVLQNLQNLKYLWVSDCRDMEEIIAPESESEEEVISAINFTLPKLSSLHLENLPELKSICSANGVMVCDSIEEITITHCPKLKRLPLYLPLHDDGQPSPPPSLRSIEIEEQQWELLEWDQPNAKSLLEPYLK